MPNGPEADNMAERWPIWFRNVKGVVVTDKGQGPYLPTWMTSPIVYNGQEVNENILKNARSYIAANESFSTGSVVIEQFTMAPPGDMYSEQDRETAMFALLMSMKEQEPVTYYGDAVSQVFVPVFDTVEGDKKESVAVVVAWIRWMDYFKGILPTEMNGVFFILKDSCGGNYTYIINGEDVEPVGVGNLHQQNYNKMMRNASFASIERIMDGTMDGLPVQHDRCAVSIEVYPSNAFHATYNTNIPAFMTAAVVLIFLSTTLLFIVYDRLVERRQRLVMASAKQTNAIVTSLFPKNVRDRLMKETAPVDDKGKKNFLSPNRRLKGFINGDQEDDAGNTPIADLFPHCTVMFCDISGFTAWSSTRDPSQVFILLQTVFQAFDKIAKRRKVFKVETIGDSYVAVTGLPEPQANHAVIMARFASECRLKMNELVNQLEKSLGPDTADLSMRFGLHSGPVTAGVLRGERARFQLFGDTVNTAARMEVS